MRLYTPRLEIKINTDQQLRWFAEVVSFSTGPSGEPVSMMARHTRNCETWAEALEAASAMIAEERGTKKEQSVEQR